MAKEKKSETVTVKTTPSIKQKLDKIAEEDDRSLSYVVDRILHEYFDSKKSKK